MSDHHPHPRPEAEPPLPYERQPGEPAPAFAAFVAYRDLGLARTVRDAYRQMKGKPGAKQAAGAWNQWAKAYRWVERAAAWDTELDRARRLRQIDQIGEMAERHAHLAVKVQAKGYAALEALDPTTLDRKELLMYIRDGTNLERLARGEPGDVTQLRMADHAGTASVRPPGADAWPDAEGMATILKILADVGVLRPPPEEVPS